MLFKSNTHNYGDIGSGYSVSTLLPTRPIARLLCLLCLTLTLSACSQIKFPKLPSFKKAKQSQEARAPAPLIASPDGEGADAMETLKVIAPPKGLNTKRLFGQDIPDTDLRVTRVENEVQRLRDDFDLVSPSITRLVAVEKDMRDLMAQLETLIDAEEQVEQDPIAMQMQNDANMPMSVTGGNDNMSILDRAEASVTGRTVQPQQINQSPPPQLATDSTISAVRFGEHRDKTRVVMDINTPTQYQARLQNGGTTLVVTLPTSAWSAQRRWNSPTSPLVRSYQVQTLANGGHEVSFNLNAASNIELNRIFPPVSNRGHRIVIDLFNSDIHLK